MRAVVLAPYRSDGAERERNWRFLRAHWESFGLEVFDADSGDPYFTPGRSLNLAAAKAGEWDVALVTDGDIMLGGWKQGQEAICLAYETGKYVLAQSLLHYLSPAGTEAVVNGADARWAEESESPIAFTGEKPYAIRRDLWDELGGYDERFSGYGGEGIAFGSAATTLADGIRIEGDCYHLDHPLIDRSTLPDLEANFALDGRYTAARGKPDAMRAILLERTRT